MNAHVVRCVAWSVLVSLALACVSPVAAAPTSQDYAALRAANKAAALRAHEDNLRRFAGQPDILALPGLLADRKARTVTLHAEAVGLDHDVPVEFFLIPDDSGKDYEALAVAWARPSDVHKALTFIGLAPGAPAQRERYRDWARGDRVAMTFRWDQPAAEAKTPAIPTIARAESLILDVRANAPLPATGLIYAGSAWLPSPEPGQPPVFAADVSDTRSIAANFNDPTTVLDVPRLAEQGAVYTFQKLNPAYRFTRGQPVTITLEPLRRDGPPCVANVTLRVSPPPGASAAALRDVKCDLLDDQGKSLAQGPTLVHVLDALAQLSQAGRDPYVTVHPGPDMSLHAVRQLYAVLASIEGDQGIRLEPPPAGHLPPRAFLAPEPWRERSQRPGNPWELQLGLDAGKLKARLIEIHQNWDVPNPPLLEERVTDLAAPEQLAAVLAEKDPRRPLNLVVLAPQDLTYGQLQQATAKLLDGWPRIHIYLLPQAAPPAVAK